MNIEEIRQKRDSLSTAILDLIKQFETETKVRVSNLDFERADVTNHFNEILNANMKLDVEIKL